MRTSTGSPLFSDFRSDLSRAEHVRFPTAGQGNDDSGNEIAKLGKLPRVSSEIVSYQQHIGILSAHASDEME